MPKSKRERKVTLSRTVSKGRPRKAAIVDEVRACADAFKDAYVFTVDNMRGAPLKIVRQKLKNSRIFFGRNKLIAAAIGRSSQDAYRDEMHRLVEHLLGGEAGLIFTNETLETVRAKLAEAEQPEYSRAGAEATSEIKLSPGDLDHFPHSMEPYLRKLGLPTRLTGGVVTLLCEHTVLLVKTVE